MMFWYFWGPQPKFHPVPVYLREGRYLYSQYLVELNYNSLIEKIAPQVIRKMHDFEIN